MSKKKCEHCVDGIALQTEWNCDICTYCGGSGEVDTAPKDNTQVKGVDMPQPKYQPVDELEHRLINAMLPGKFDGMQLVRVKSICQAECSRARKEGFVGAKVACSFNADCKNCEANRLALDFLAAPTKQIMEEKQS